MLKKPESSKYHMDQAFINEEILVFYNWVNALVESQSQWYVIWLSSFSYTFRYYYLCINRRFILTEDWIQFLSNWNSRFCILPFASSVFRLLNFFNLSYLIPSFPFAFNFILLSYSVKYCLQYLILNKTLDPIKIVYFFLFNKLYLI